MEHTRKKLRRARGDVIYDTIIFIILTFLFLIVAYPLYFVIISSISDPIAVSAGKVVFTPVGFTLDGYKEVFKTKTVMRGFLNSLIITIMGTSINLLVTIPTSYALQNDLNLPVSDIIATYTYRYGIIKSDISYSSAVGLMNSIVNSILLVTVNYITGKMSDNALF